MRRSLSFSTSTTILLAALAVFGSGVPAHAAGRDRIASAIDGSSRVFLSRTVSPKASASTDLGVVAPARQMQDLSLNFSMTAAQQAALDQLLADQQNPSSARFHQWLTPAQFGARFGLSTADLAKVSSWLQAQGFTVTATANGRTFMRFSGTAAQVQQALGTSIHNLSLGGEQHIGNLAEPRLPSVLAGVVANVSGLNDFRLKSRARMRQVSASAVRPQNTVNTTANGIQHYMAPGDFYTIYDLNPLLTNSVNGSGVTIAVMGQVDLTPADVAAFRTASGLSASTVTTKTYGTDPGSPSARCSGATPPANCFPSVDDLSESLLDVEWAGAVAPGASILFVNSQDVLGISLLSAVDNNLAPIMTVSYGDCEANIPASERASLNQAFQQASAQGITITGPTGDTGATDCDFGVTTATQGLAVDFPASSPFVTAVGGTMFNEGSSTYWNANNGANGGSAISYIPEAVWNETAADLAKGAGQFGAGGGGASAYFAKPAWQTGAGVPNDSSRDVPDVSLNSAATHDGYLVCAQSSCTSGGYFDANGIASVFGGTSVATPSFAGILALVEQKLGGGRLGNVNPQLYALGNSTFYNNVFHDIQTGNNSSPCTAGTTNCPNGGYIGYNAGSGYDLASGLGSVDAAVLANTWSTVTPAASGDLAVSTTSVSSTTTSVTVGVSIPLTVTVASGTTSATGTPSGTVQFLLDGSAVASSTVPLSGGAASYSLATTGLTSGAHLVTAVYSGDSTFSSSKGSLNIDIISASLPDFSLTPATTSITLASGSSSTGTTFTVTPKNGFTGNIVFSSVGSINATYAINPTSIAISSSTTSATASYTLSAYVVNGQTGQLALKRVASANQPPPLPRGRWYMAGSGSVLAGLLLVCVPRRRRWGSLLAILLMAAALGTAGCGSSSSTTGTTGTTQTNTSPGTYTVTLTAIGTPASGTAITHNAVITVIVQ